MTLEELGYNSSLEDYRNEAGLEAFGVGRIISEHRERYLVHSGEHIFEGEIIGNLRFTARNRSDFPAVGDWVATIEYDDDKVLIHAVYPRRTVLERQAAGKEGEKQIIAANIDQALIVQAADQDFNINRIERYLAICNTAGVKPIIVLNKTDLINEETLGSMVDEIKSRIEDVPVFAISNATGHGIEQLIASLEKGKTYSLLGSSGVGKSTLVNHLSGKQTMKTDAISSSTGKGRHVTSHRELSRMKCGALLIDNPGMREVGITESEEGLALTFNEISALAEDCRFNDCKHLGEDGCAVLAAVENGELDRPSYENFLKMERERAHFESTLAERRKKDKEFGKMVKQIKKEKGI